MNIEINFPEALIDWNDGHTLSVTKENWDDPRLKSSSIYLLKKNDDYIKMNKLKKNLCKSIPLLFSAILESVF